MNNEIKEILQLIGNAYYYGNIDYEKEQKYCDYITNLQKENERLKEEYVMLQNASDEYEDELEEKIEKANKYLKQFADYLTDEQIKEIFD